MLSLDGTQIYISNSGTGDQRRLTVDGSLVGALATPTFFFLLRKDGNWWVQQSAGPAAIADASFNILTSTAFTFTNNPQSWAVDTDNALYVADNQVVGINPDGTTSGSRQSPTTAPAESP